MGRRRYDLQLEMKDDMNGTQPGKMGFEEIDGGVGPKRGVVDGMNELGRDEDGCILSLGWAYEKHSWDLRWHFCIRVDAFTYGNWLSYSCVRSKSRGLNIHWFQLSSLSSAR